MVRFWVCIFKVKLIMKKLLTVLALGIFALGFSQNYYDDYREVLLLLTGEMWLLIWDLAEDRLQLLMY